MTPDPPRDLKTLERRVLRLEDVLTTFIAWTAQSAGSPISISDAKELLRRLESGDDA